MDVDYGILGPLRVSDAGVEIEIRRGISRTLLIVLLLRAPETVSAGALMELLWGDEQPRNPANALHIQISYLRKTLAAGAPGGRQPIVTRPGGYSLDIDLESIDAVRFENLLLEVDRIGPRFTEEEARTGLPLVEEALGLWRGEVLADVVGEAFAEGAVTRLEEMRWTATELRIDLLLALGRHRDAVGELGKLIADQPLRERFHEQLVLALYRCGRQADALRAYDSARATLLEELGLDPGPALQQLQSDVLAQHPSLDWRSRNDADGERSLELRRPDWKQPSVPSPLTSLIGRTTELERLAELMEHSRLVTLTGPGGAGKTRLAIDLAAIHPSPVWFIDLSALELADQVGPTVAAAIGATTGPTEDPVEVVASALSTETGLLVLDTCEHVLPGASALASTLLRQAPRMRVLATSRRPLAVTGESAWPVPPLGVASPDPRSIAEIQASPAVQLFCQRAQAVQPDFELAADNAADVASICLALDGLPLAIELAAARADVLPPAAILDRLHDRFDLLVEGAADSALRQQTLRGAIDWSVSLLSDEQRTFFARLSAFAGEFDLAAAGAVAADDASDALNLLTSLVRHSMVVTSGTGRYRLLDTLRAYSNELLADLDADATRRRHAEHYAELAERSEMLIRGKEQADALRRLRADTANFRTALEWSIGVGDLDVAMRLAGSLAWFWALDGRLDIATLHLRRAMEVEDVPQATRAKVLWGYSLLVAGLGDLEDALHAAELSVSLARSDGDNASIGAGLNAMAVALWARGDFDSAAAAHDEAVERFVVVDDVWGESICRVLRARTAFDRQEPNADDQLRIALDRARQSGDVHVLGLGLGLLADRQASCGQLDHAISTATESLNLQESIGYTEGVISALHLLARFDIQSGDEEAATTKLLRALRLAWKMQHAAAVCEALEGLAVLAMNDGDTRSASRLWSVASEERDRRGLAPRIGDRPLVDALRVTLPTEAIGAAPTSLAEVISDLLS